MLFFNASSSVLPAEVLLVNKSVNRGPDSVRKIYRQNWKRRNDIRTSKFLDKQNVSFWFIFWDFWKPWVNPSPSSSPLYMDATCFAQQKTCASLLSTSGFNLKERCCETRGKKPSCLVNPLLTRNHQKPVFNSAVCVRFPLNPRLYNPFRQPSLSCANKHVTNPKRSGEARRERGLNLFQMAPGDDIIYPGWVWFPR